MPELFAASAVIVRPAGPDLWDFLGCGPMEHREDVEAYVARMLSLGSMRREWCFVAEAGGVVFGRLAFWSLPHSKAPSDFVLFDVDWGRGDSDRLALDVIEQAKKIASGLGASHLGHVLDSPAQSPQWQGDTERRYALSLSAGLKLRRETQRYHLAPEQQPEWDDSADLQFRSLREIGSDRFRQLVALSAAQTLDRTIDPDTIYEEAFTLEFEDDWWEAAYTSDGGFVGTVLPVRAPAFSTIGFIGVVPEVRGKGLGALLLRRGSWTLSRKAAPPFRSDVDMLNTPMRSAFEKTGWRPFARRLELAADLGMGTG